MSSRRLVVGLVAFALGSCTYVRDTTMPCSSTADCHSDQYCNKVGLCTSRRGVSAPDAQVELDASLDASEPKPRDTMEASVRVAEQDAATSTGSTAKTPCDPNPCQHAGKCFSDANAFTCDCAGTGFEGFRCDRNVDECSTANNGCSPAAKCVDTPGSRQCMCPSTHVGDGLGAGGCRRRLTMINAGWASTCALGEDGQVFCWGLRSTLGDAASTQDRATPGPVPGLADAVALGSGAAKHQCAILKDSTARCWGENSFGQLGNGSDQASLSPQPVIGLVGVKQLAVGLSTTCAVMNDGTLSCFGFPVGDGTAQPSATPKRVPGLENVQQVSIGYSHICARLQSGKLACWGRNALGQLGTDGTDYLTSPVTPSVVGTATHISVAADNTCVLLPGANIRCFGGFSRDGTPRQPLDLAAGDVSWIAISLEQIYARRKDSLVSWTVMGGNAAPGLSVAWDTVHVSIGVTHACAILRDFSVLCWGANAQGELGDGTTSNRDGSVRVLDF